MITFRGEISKECNNFLRKKIRNSAVLTFLIMSVFFSIIFIILALTLDKSLLLFLVVIIPFLIVFCLLMATTEQFIVSIEIGENYLAALIRTINRKTNSIVHDIEDVKEVIDMGDWYNITFYFPHKDIFFVCQKNLMIQGSIEEFEALFEDKLVRKTDC